MSGATIPKASRGATRSELVAKTAIKKFPQFGCDWERMPRRVATIREHGVFHAQDMQRAP